MVRLVKMNDGVVYALVGAGDGLVVYNVTVARTLTNPISDDQGSEYPNVFLGFLPGTQNQNRIFIDTIHIPATDRVPPSVTGATPTTPTSRG